MLERTLEKGGVRRMEGKEDEWEDEWEAGAGKSEAAGGG